VLCTSSAGHSDYQSIDGLKSIKIVTRNSGMQTSTNCKKLDISRSLDSGVSPDLLLPSI